MTDDGDSDFSSNGDSSDDLELFLNEPRLKNENYLEDIVPQYSDTVFFEHFRVSREIANNISERFANSHYYSAKSGQYGNSSALSQVLIYLWFIGHQTASFRDIGDRFDITISSVNRIIYKLTYFLSNLGPEIITWPTEAEKRISEQHFRANGFPNIIGAIDGSHIKIDRPDNDPDSYINRKGYYSIQLQAVCDHRKKIIDLFLGYPGSVHDSRVFRNSPLKNNMEEKCGRYFILGDSGYPLQNHLLTPFKDRGNLSRRQQNYNVQLAKNRYVIEHCFGILKQKFRQMYHLKLRKIRGIVHVIRAACVLHNIALDNEFNLEDDQEANPLMDGMAREQNDDDDDSDEEQDVVAAAIRDRIANLF